MTGLDGVEFGLDDVEVAGGALRAEGEGVVGCGRMASIVGFLGNSAVVGFLNEGDDVELGDELSSWRFGG